MMICTRNLLEGLPANSISAPLPAAGYAVTDLCDGTMARGYLQGANALSAAFTFNLPASELITCAALFDVTATKAITSCTISVGGWAEPIPLSPRGDGAIVYPSRSSPQVTVTIHLASSGRVSVGEMWAGRWTSLARRPRGPLPIRRVPNVVRNGDFASRLEPHRHAIDLAWDRMLRVDHQALLDVYDATDDGTRPVVIVPDPSRMTEAYMGRVDGAVGWAVDRPVYSGHGLKFFEGRRAHV